MNFLLLYPNELDKSKTIGVVSGKRFSFIRERYTLSEGQRVNAGLIDGNLGYATVTKISDTSISFNLVLDKEPPIKQDLILIVSICRPQTNKKILHIATSLGVKKVLFVRGENVPKSYIQSTSLNEENIKNECLLAMAQTGDTIFPSVVIYKSIFDCFKNETFTINNTYLVADTSCKLELNRKNFENFDSVKCIAIGPESGWSEQEIEFFHQKGFKSIGLGDRILRVEVAINYMLGKLSV